MSTQLPTKYKWLESEGAPKLLVEFLRIYNTEEYAGAANNPIIMGWAKEVGLHKVYAGDSIAWCGLTMAVLCKRAGKEIPKDPLWALNWANVGTKVSVPMLGDILTFKRYNKAGSLVGGHVGIYLGETDKTYFVGGGNQGDRVSIVEISKSRLYQARRPKYNVQPTNVRVIKLDSTGKISQNEA